MWLKMMDLVTFTAEILNEKLLLHVVSTQLSNGLHLIRLYLIQGVPLYLKLLAIRRSMSIIM